MRADVLIVTALQIEYDAVLSVETGSVAGALWEEYKDANGLPYAIRNFASESKDSSRPLSIAVTCAAAMGDVAATVVTLPLMDALLPQVIAMCGVCAGRPGKTNLGDVVAADKLFFHDSGKRASLTSSNGEQVVRIQQDLATYHLRTDWKRALESIKPKRDYASATWLAARPVPVEWQEIRVLQWAKEHPGEVPPKAWGEKNCPQWKEVLKSLRTERTMPDGTRAHLLEKTSIRLTENGQQELSFRMEKYFGEFPDLGPFEEVLPFTVHVASFGSGDQVVEDNSIWTFITESMRKTLGLDMEAAALGAIAHYQRAAKVDAIVMKGVMDFANHGRDDHFKDFAARASAECLIDFVRKNVPTNTRLGFDDLLSDGMAPPPTVPSPSQLLDARYAVVPWHDHGRSTVLEQLDEWADDEKNAVSVQLLHAEGGVGKTRLAIEWVHRRKGRHDNAGFLARRPNEHWLERLCGMGQPTIVVIDYAESRTDLGTLLRRVSDYYRQPGPKRRLRVLLLARNAGDWWSALRRGDTILRSMLEQTKPMELTAATVRETEREALFREAAEAFAAVRRKNVIGRAPVRFEDERFGRILYIHMAALAAVDDQEIAPNTLMNVILDHEERFWAERGRESGNVRLEHTDIELGRQIMAAATLRGGFPTAEKAKEVLCRIASELGADSDLHELLHRIYGRPDESMWLAGLEPDLLGENLVARISAGDGASGSAQTAWVNRVFSDNDAEAIVVGFTVLGRASARHDAALRLWIDHLLGQDLLTRSTLAFEAAKAVGRQTAFSVLGDALAEHLSKNGTVEIARNIEQSGLPESSVSLVRVISWVSRTLNSVTTGGKEVLSTEMRAEQAERAAALSIRLSELGSWKESLDYASEAVGLYRQLSESDPDNFLFQLANALVLQGASHRDLGEEEDALKHTKEAIDIYRAIDRGILSGYPMEGRERLRVINPGLAAALNNEGEILSEMGSWEKAIASTEESVNMYRLLALNSDQYKPQLASGLGNLSNRFIELNRWHDALLSSQESTELFRELAHINPDAHLPDLALNLLNLGRILSMPDPHDDALTPTREAIDIYRRLAAFNPGNYRPDLAIGLNNLSSMLSGLGMWEEAIGFAEEAVSMRRLLASENPNAHEPDLSITLGNLGGQLFKLKKFEQALLITEEALDLIWPHFERLPNAFVNLAMTLNSQALALCAALGRPATVVLIARSKRLQRHISL